MNIGKNSSSGGRVGDYHFYRFKNEQQLRERWPFIENRLCALGHADVPTHIHLDEVHDRFDDVDFNMPVSFRCRFENDRAMEEKWPLIAHSLPRYIDDITLEVMGSEVSFGVHGEGSGEMRHYGRPVNIEAPEAHIVWGHASRDIRSLSTSAGHINAFNSDISEIYAPKAMDVILHDCPNLRGKVTENTIVSRNYIGGSRSLALYNRQSQEFASDGPNGREGWYRQFVMGKQKKFHEGYISFVKDVALIEKGVMPNGYCTSLSTKPYLPILTWAM